MLEDSLISDLPQEFRRSVQQWLLQSVRRHCWRGRAVAVTHGAARYRGYASPVVQPTESRRLLQAWVKGKTPATWCAFHSPEDGSLIILVQLVCCDIVSGPSAGALMSLIPSPLLVARDSGSLSI